MRRSLTGIGLAGSALLGLLLASGGLAGSDADRPMDPADVLRQLGVPNSIADQWVEPYVPLWALTQDAPIVGVEGTISAFNGIQARVCPPSFELPLPTERVAVRFDSTRMITELYSRDATGFIARFNVSANLTYTVDTVPIDLASPWLAADLDQDGEVDLVSQWGSVLKIHSAPDWSLRTSFGWSGADVAMHPQVVNIDDDPYLEIYATPNSFSSSRVVLIKYDTATDNFAVIADISAPMGASGQPAVGDFDEDGRMEFISACYDYGYGLFEWQDPVLTFIGLVGDIPPGNNYCAVACRPKPGGVLHALLGHSSLSNGHLYQLLEPIGDNIFTLTRTFQEFTGAVGIHPCQAVDTDCDGLDELAMLFYPRSKVWQWDVGMEQFVNGCIWEFDTYGTLSKWHTLDSDQNAAPEWGTVSNTRIFRIFPDPDCLFCDSSGDCDPAGVTCYCYCHADPKCDGVTDVLDVVAAVDVAFRSATPYLDPHPQCPYERTDTDCDGVTNVLDVVHFVNVAFRSGGPSSEFCQSCP